MSKGKTVKGFRAIEEILNAGGSIKSLTVRGKPSSRERELIERARQARVPVHQESGGHNSSRSHGPHSAQVLEAQVDGFSYADFDAIVSGCRQRRADGGKATVVLLDGITDPHNLGAIIRTAAYMGVAALVIPQDRAVQVNETVMRIASGGIEHVPVCQVANVAQAIEKLQESGFWAVGLAEKGGTVLSEREPAPLVALVIGSEEKGLRPLVMDRCDELLRLNAAGNFTTLNASVAAALAMAWSVGTLGR